MRCWSANATHSPVLLHNSRCILISRRCVHLRRYLGPSLDNPVDLRDYCGGLRCWSASATHSPVLAYQSRSNLECEDIPEIFAGPILKTNGNDENGLREVQSRGRYVCFNLPHSFLSLFSFASPCIVCGTGKEKDHAALDATRAQQ